MPEIANVASSFPVHLVTASPPRLTAVDARERILAAAHRLDLIQDTANKVLAAAGLPAGPRGPVAAQDLPAGFRAPASAHARGAVAMLETLERAVRSHPKLGRLCRDQFAQLWVRLGARAGARQAWTRLAARPRFWTGLSNTHRRIVAWHLVNDSIPPADTASRVERITGHWLFRGAHPTDRYNALANLCAADTLLKKTLLPSPAQRRRDAARLEAQHLGHMKPASRRILHQQILARARFVQANFFTPVPGSKPVRVYGTEHLQAFGSDWYRQCLDLIQRQGERNACRSAYKLMGVHKGADEVCGR